MTPEPIYEFHKSQGWVANFGVLIKFKDKTCRVTVVDRPVIDKYYDYWVKDELWDFEYDRPNWDNLALRYASYSLGSDVSKMTAKDYRYFEDIGYYENNRFWLLIEECK